MCNKNDLCTVFSMVIYCNFLVFKQQQIWLKSEWILTILQTSWAKAVLVPNIRNTFRFLDPMGIGLSKYIDNNKKSLFIIFFNYMRATGKMSKWRTLCIILYPLMFTMSVGLYIYFNPSGSNIRVKSEHQQDWFES